MGENCGEFNLYVQMFHLGVTELQDWIKCTIHDFSFVFTFLRQDRWSPPHCNLHRLITPETPIPFNYNRCPFWLIACLHSVAFLTLMLYLSPGVIKPTIQCRHLRVHDNEQKNVFVLLCLRTPVRSFVSGGSSHGLVFLFWQSICLLLRVCPALPVRRERTETSEQW